MPTAADNTPDDLPVEPEDLPEGVTLIKAGEQYLYAPIEHAEKMEGNVVEVIQPPHSDGHSPNNSGTLDLT